MNLPTTHGQREGSLVRPFMSKRQRKNSLPDTRSRGGERWGEKEREREGERERWEAGEGGIKKEGGGVREGGGGGGCRSRRREREFSWKQRVVGVGCILVLKARVGKETTGCLLQP